VSELGGEAGDAAGSLPAGVVLWAHLPYYRHAALALHRAGLLRRYVSAPFATRPLPGGRRVAAAGPVGYFERTRVFPELAGVPARRLWLAQGVAAGAQRVASAVARRRGALVVADVRALHPHVHHRGVNQLLAPRGLTYVSPDRCILDRMLRELDGADLLVCNSELTRRSFLEEGFDPQRVVAVPLGCDPTRFTPSAALPPRFTVLFVGREPTLKGLPDLIDAAAVLPRDARLVIAGEIDDATRQALARLTIEVVELGNVGVDDMPDLYRQASVLVLPSLSEAFGLVVLEAMAAGVPVIVSDAVGAADLLSDGVDGYIVPAGSPAEIAARLEVLIADPDRTLAMGRAARITAAEHSWDRYGDRLVQAYRQVILPLSG